MLNILENLLEDGIDLLLLAVALMAILFVIMTWVRTKSLVPTLGAVVLGALVIFGANQMQSGGVIGDAVEEDITDRRGS